MWHLHFVIVQFQGRGTHYALAKVVSSSHGKKFNKADCKHPEERKKNLQTH